LLHNDATSLLRLLPRDLLREVYRYTRPVHPATAPATDAPQAIVICAPTEHRSTLPQWHCYMEGPSNVTQRKITLARFLTHSLLQSPWSGCHLGVRVTFGFANTWLHLPLGTLHPNGLPSGILNLDSCRMQPQHSNETVLRLLQQLSQLLRHPDLKDPGQESAYLLLTQGRTEEYDGIVRLQCAQLPLPPLPDLERELTSSAASPFCCITAIGS
jgi:hypothetical protein